MNKLILPEVGIGATLGIGSDRYPFKIVRVSKSRQTFWMKPVDYKAALDSNYYDEQKYEYGDVIKCADEIRVFLCKNGHWKVTNGGFVGIGYMVAYQDPSF